MSTEQLEFSGDDGELAEAVYERMRPELAAVPEKELLTPRVNVVKVVSIALACVDNLRTLRPQFQALLPAFALRYLDCLSDCAWGLRHSHTRYLMCSRPPNCSAEEVEQGTALRVRLLADANGLAARNLIDRSTLKNVGCLNGYKHLANDLDILAGVLKSHWPTIEGRCACTRAELDQALTLSNQFTRAIGRRNKKTVSLRQAMLDRRRAFTLFLRTYEETRRSVNYVRWYEDDADSYVPSLFANRKPRRRAEKPAEPTEIQPDQTTGTKESKE